MKLQRRQVALFTAALALYGAGIWWGIPQTEPRERPDSWATDELAPAGLLEEIANTIYFRSGVYNPKYPIFGYVIQGAPTLPYYVAVAGLDTQKARTLAIARPIAFLARTTTVILSAGLCIVAWETAAVLWGPTAAWIAGLLTLLFPPLYYYGRTSNTDAPALVFTAITLYFFARILRGEFTPPVARGLAIFAALAISIKDTAFGAIVPAGIIVLFLQWNRNRPLVLRTALISATVYLLASGLLLNPDRYWKHIYFIRHGSPRHYGIYYGSKAPYSSVLAATGEYIAEHLGIVLLLLILAGAALCLKSGRRKLLLWLIPAAGIVALTIMPVRFVVYRFPIVTSYCLLFFGTFSLAEIYARRRAAALLLLALVCGRQALHNFDMTWLMFHDSRYEAGDWFARNARPGDRIGYFGTEPNKLPFTDPAIGLEHGPAKLPTPGSPEFLIVEPYQRYESVHEYDLPEATYRAMIDGTAGYRQMLAVRSKPVFGYQPNLALNPPVRIFVREDRLPSLRDREPRIALPD